MVTCTRAIEVEGFGRGWVDECSLMYQSTYHGFTDEPGWLGGRTPPRDKHNPMSILNQKLELMVADCNLLRTRNAELMETITDINHRLYQMELALQSWKEEPSKESTTGSLTEDNIEDIISFLELEEVITDHIHERTDWSDVIKVDLSLSGNEIETECDADRWDIERYIARDLSSVIAESIREVLQTLESFTTKKEEVSDDSI